MLHFQSAVNCRNPPVQLILVCLEAKSVPWLGNKWGRYSSAEDAWLAACYVHLSYKSCNTKYGSDNEANAMEVVSVTARFLITIQMT